MPFPFGAIAASGAISASDINFGLSAALVVTVIGSLATLCEPPFTACTMNSTELTPNERIRYTDTFDDPNLPGEIQVSITLRKVSCGTDLNIVQENVPDVIPPEACYLGWQESLTLLAKLVEAEIPD